MNGADALCDTLLAAGVDTCFANPGTSEMHFVAALDRKPQMRCVLGLSEGVVTGAADGYARMADKPAATLLHLGPGLANGLANLHNARRANSPVVNIVGDHATYHLQYDAPLTTDIEMLARPMSHWVKTVPDADHVSAFAAEAVAQARSAAGRIATLILPADAAWNTTEAPLQPQRDVAPRRHVAPERMRDAVQAIRSGKRVVLMLSGLALREQALRTAGRIASACGVRLLAQQSNARLERGAGRLEIERVPYPVDQALAALQDVDCLILLGAVEPVAFFAYPGKPSRIAPAHCTVLELAAPGDDLPHALAWLADELDVPADLALDLPAVARPALPSGALNPVAIATALAALMPEQAILCDESVSSGRSLFQYTRNLPPHDYLQLTGGAIGLGLPMAAGAAIACPGRKVISLEADGSGMYTVQALWTQARESLDVVTIIYANRAYAILHGELRQVGAGEPGTNASRMLNLDQPALDWVRLAQGMGVEAVRVETAEAFGDALRAALGRRGPFLIEAVI
ncbi:acetolactate synthase large subunit|uniref:acetolactate synthase large subunit n=1 Tax=Noviherbaspirillum sp. L7-7A TaxID=2850560 RepID=UPI001C2C35FD|nr:acetolactate synthase large subunit [Noviherbaspirillum sp. L7-7A]MBV0879388.1 acetolactate synthase large subunit [Noviherbaspirillum sp. L7-7A]